MKGLAALPVVVLDAQATAASSAGGALVELGWATSRACEALRADEVSVHVVAPPPGAVLPPAVARITGLARGEWERGEAPARVWRRLQEAAERIAPASGAVAAVVHFARFEEPFLRALHERHGCGPYPFDSLCTHAIAARLLPELPRRTLRALAGYFGGSVAPLRRSAEHVAATALVWRELVALLAEREGVFELGELREWLARPARRSPRCFPLPRERRLEPPPRPGVYRLERAGGSVLYVGKAASLRQRVSGHFHARSGRDERALEMLTQVRELTWSETETALEAALLEADEIKRLSPPYNVALTPARRSLWYADRELHELRSAPDRAHPVGPLASTAPFAGLEALQTALASETPLPLRARARAVGVDPRWAPEPVCFAAGLARFAAAHEPAARSCGLLQLGARLWFQRRAARAGDSGEAADAGATAAPEAAPRSGWDAERVTGALEETLVRASHAVRRARLLVWLSESCLAWSERGGPRRRLLVIRRGEVEDRGWLAPGAPLPVPPGHACPGDERRAAFDLAGFDRLRVLVSELRLLAARDDGRAAEVELRLGRTARLRGRRLRAVLAAV